MNLESAAAIVTGGASGIGEACARQLAELGARVVASRKQQAVHREGKPPATLIPR